MLVRIAGTAAAASCLFITPLIAAQTAAEIDAARRQAEQQQRLEQEQFRREQDRIRRPERAPEGVDTRKLEPTIKVPGDRAECRDISIIAIQNAPHLAQWVREEIDRDFARRCLGVAELEKILGAITHNYVLRGYITARAYLPPQDLAGGRLEINVVEGRVERIDVNDGEQGSVSIGNAFPMVIGRVLNLRDLEQGIDQLNRLQSNNAKLDIKPGSRPGDSIVVVENEPKRRLRVNASWDNYGQISTGRNQIGAVVTMDNPTSFNDMLSYSRRQSTAHSKDTRDLVSDNLLYSIPFGYTTVTAGAGWSNYATAIVAPSGQILKSNGDNETANLRLDRIVHRDQSSRMTLSSSLTMKQSKNFLEQQLLEVSSRALTVLDLDANYFSTLLGGTLGLDAGYAQGLRTLGALVDPTGLPDNAPRAQFRKLKYGAIFNRAFKLAGEDLSFSTSLTGQRGLDTLYGSEQIAIGGLFSVRGFHRNSLTGDNGQFVRNDLSIRRTVSADGETFNLRGFVGLDFGRVRNRVQNIREGGLIGGAIGMAINWRGAMVDLSYARALRMPDTLEREKAQVWFRLAYTY